MSGPRLTQPVALYRGPFLDGFYLDGAPEFERWVESERSRLALRHAECLQRLAEAATEAGDVGAAVAWRRRSAESDPLSSRLALALMQALVTADDTGAALQHAQVYSRLVRKELASAPDPSITTYADKLRQGRSNGVNGAAPVHRPPAPNETPVDVPISSAPSTRADRPDVRVHDVPARHRATNAPCGRAQRFTF